MNIKRVASFAAVALAGTCAGVTLTLAGGAAAASTTTLHVQELATYDTYVPVQPLIGSKSQSNRGDMLAFNDKMVKPGGTTSIGNVRGTCTQVAPTASLFYCTVAFTVSGKGQIFGTGLFDATGKHTTVGEVTGGTGSYDLVRGTVKVKALSQSKNDFVFTLVH